LTFRDATREEIRRWQAALIGFVRKLSFKYDRPLVLKSPGHTGRIRMLLEIFPDARFVHIHRHPVEVYRSTVHTFRTVSSLWRMQRFERPDWNEVIIRQYKEVCEAFFNQRDLIPPERFHELSYADLERDPLGEMERLYATLSLPDFAVVKPKLVEYLDSLAGYRKNKFGPLDPALRERVYHDCRRCFDEWGYSAAPAESDTSAAATGAGV
jgi:hypothetical protein